MFIVLTDFEPPKFVNCPTSQMQTFTTAGKATGIIDYPQLTTSDNSNMNVSITCDVMPGFLLPIGEKTVTCTATDFSGNEITCSFEVVVIGKLYVLLKGK